jgi:hypothetical protein
VKREQQNKLTGTPAAQVRHSISLGHGHLAMDRLLACSDWIFRLVFRAWAVVFFYDIVQHSDVILANVQIDVAAVMEYQ